MKISILFLLATFSTLISCNFNDKKYRLIEEISINSLHKSNQALSELSSANYNSLREKLRNTIYGEKIELWNNKAEKLKLLTSEILPRIANAGDIDHPTPI